jgi:hypothetical protein
VNAISSRAVRSAAFCYPRNFLECANIATESVAQCGGHGGHRIARYNLGESQVRGEGRGIQMLLTFEINVALWGNDRLRGNEISRNFSGLLTNKPSGERNGDPAQPNDPSDGSDADQSKPCQGP